MMPEARQASVCLSYGIADSPKCLTQLKAISNILRPHVMEIKPKLVQKGNTDAFLLSKAHWPDCTLLQCNRPK